MKQALLIAVIILFSSIKVISQTSKFGKITDEQWKIKSCVLDSTAHAIVLFDKGETTIKGKEDVKNHDPDCPLVLSSFVLTYTRHTRIKILNQKDSIFYFIPMRVFDKKKDDLKSFNGLCQWQENGKISENKLTRKELKKVNAESNSYTLRLDLSKVKEGSIVDINYSFESDIFTELPLWNFSNDFPTAYSEINYSIPDFFEINRSCTILNTLLHETDERQVKYRVSYEIPEGWNDKVYSFNAINEKYARSNIASSQKKDQSYILKSEISNINLSTVSSKQESWRTKR
jgi:hypothetical protein